MPLNSIVDVTILTTSAGITRAGFGTPCIVSYKPTWVERTRTYSDASAMLTDGFTSTDPEYLAASALCAQKPRPTSIIIGRAVNKPTQKYKLACVLVKDATAYTVRTNLGDATFTSDASATNDEVMTGLSNAINGVVGKNFTSATTGSVGSTYIEVTGNSAGAWFSVEVLDVNLLSNAQTHVAPDVASDLTAIKNENNKWYAPITLFNSKAYVVAVAAWVESNKKLYGAASCDTDIITTAASGASDVASTLLASSYFRSFAFYHPSPMNVADAALMGRQLPLDPGSETWKFVTLAGVPVVTFTDTHLVNLTDKRCMHYFAEGNSFITSEGKVASGEWIDVVRFIDWLVARLQEDVFNLFKKQSDLGKKVPYTTVGFTMVEGVIRARLQDGVDVGGLSNESVEIDGVKFDPGPAVKMPLMSSIATSDKQARKLTGIKFAGILAGAVHAAKMTGVVTN